ncbi:MAG: hypothetical protein NT160_01765 [Actinobacteria bacterium]|nr:hypothetical protein [Actinomycetota bacterium]
MTEQQAEQELVVAMYEVTQHACVSAFVEADKEPFSIVGNSPKVFVPVWVALLNIGLPLEGESESQTFGQAIEHRILDRLRHPDDNVRGKTIRSISSGLDFREDCTTIIEEIVENLWYDFMLPKHWAIWEFLCLVIRR